MALDTGNYISDLSRLNPTATDPVSEGDDVLRFIKKDWLWRCFCKTRVTRNHS